MKKMKYRLNLNSAFIVSVFSFVWRLGIIALLFIVYDSNCLAQDFGMEYLYTSKTWESHELYGNVKFMHQTSFYSDTSGGDITGVIEDNFRVRGRLQYDEFGYLMIEESHWRDEDLDVRREYNYNMDSLFMIHEMKIGEEAIITDKCKIDEHRNVTEVMRKETGDEKYNIEAKMSYDTAGRLVETRLYHGVEEIQELFLKKYGKNAQDEAKVTEDYRYTTFGAQGEHKIYEYNTNGKIIREQTFEFNFDYNLKKKPPKDATEYMDFIKGTTSAEKLQRTIVYEYDHADHLIQRSIYAGEKMELKAREIITYDQNGNAVSVLQVDTTTDPITRFTLSYLYDTHGNWISQKISDDNEKLLSVIKRSFEYYE